MILQLREKQEEIKAKKKYQENINKIIDLDDACKIIDDVKCKISNIDYEFKNSHIKKLECIQDKIIDEMILYEEQNMKII